MNLKRYQNELIVGGAFFIMLMALLYKGGQINAQKEEQMMTQNSISELKEVIALKRIWADQKLSSKVDMLKTIVPTSKVTWNKKRNKVTANYKALSQKELNRVGQKVLNLGVQIQKFDIQKSGQLYDVELLCRW